MDDSDSGEKDLKRQKGFSLIELLVVVAIILIIAAIAIPNLLRSRIAANESSAVSSLRTINTAEVSYATTYANIGYSADLKSLGPGAGTACAATGPTSKAACLLDSVLSTAAKNGYNFGYTSTLGTGAAATLNVTYEAEAVPQTFNQTGLRGFCSIDDSVIRWEADGTVPMGANCTTLTALQ